MNPAPLLRSLRAALALATLPFLAQADTIIVNQINFAFVPQDVTIQVGDTVRWVRSDGNHDVTEGTDGTVDGNEAFFGMLDANHPDFEWTFDQAFLDSFPRPGNVYDYFCSPHFTFGQVGSVTVVSEPGTSYCDCTSAAAAPCGNPGGAGEGCANTTGSGGLLAATGTASVSADDVEFQVSNLLPAQPALLFVGVNATNGGSGFVFGDGLRCAGGSVVRLGVHLPDTLGNADWGPGLAAQGGWSNGDTRRFQVWYRNPAGGGVCGSGFNLSNGYEIDFGA